VETILPGRKGSTLIKRWGNWLRRLPQSEACRLIDFEEVDVVTLEIFPPQHVLIVSGTKPYLNMEVSLRPRTYTQQPEYWGIEVVGCLSGFGLPALAPYAVSIRLAGFMGTKGIEVIGATRSEKIELGDLSQRSTKTGPALKRKTPKG